MLLKFSSCVSIRVEPSPHRFAKCGASATPSLGNVTRESPSFRCEREREAKTRTGSRLSSRSYGNRLRRTRVRKTTLCQPLRGAAERERLAEHFCNARRVRHESEGEVFRREPWESRAIDDVESGKCTRRSVAARRVFFFPRCHRKCAGVVNARAARQDARHRFWRDTSELA